MREEQGIFTVVFLKERDQDQGTLHVRTYQQRVLQDGALESAFYSRHPRGFFRILEFEKVPHRWQGQGEWARGSVKPRMAVACLVGFPSDSTNQPGARTPVHHQWPLWRYWALPWKYVQNTFIQIRTVYLTNSYFISLINSGTNMVSLKMIFDQEWCGDIRVC